jgi:hypothetical protein
VPAQVQVKFTHNCTTEILLQAAREAADAYRGYRTSLSDDALDEAGYARNEQAQATRLGINSCII